MGSDVLVDLENSVPPLPSRAEGQEAAHSLPQTPRKVRSLRRRIALRVGAGMSDKQEGSVASFLKKQSEVQSLLPPTSAER